METSSTLEALLVRNNELLAGIYVVLLWTLGVVFAVFVLFLLYKFIRLFF